MSARDSVDDTQPLAAVDPDRAVLSVDGAEAEAFLQNLVSNDVSRAGVDRAVYAALLTPQGKFLSDMMISRHAPRRFLLETDRESRDGLVKRLTMYKLRAKLDIAAEDSIKVAVFWSESPEALRRRALSFPPGSIATAYEDPRDPALGLRVLTDQPETLIGALPGDLAEHERLRVALAVPKAGLDLVANDTFPLEAGFERAHGVDFKKGCYVGQEVTARMRHKAELKKRLVRLRVVSGAAEPGAEIRAGDRLAGRLGSVVGDEALAVLRVDRLQSGQLSADSAILTPVEPLA